MSNTSVVIIHGTYGGPQENWFPWLASEVRRSGYEATVPTFPTPQGQNVQSWREAFAKQVGSLHEDMILVGHSLAPAFILRLLEESQSSVAGIFLVSGFLGALGLPEFDPINAPFFEPAFNWRRVTANAGSIHVYNSDNDPYVPLDKGRELARNLGVELTVIKNGGHINATAGFVRFERLLSDILKLAESQ